MADFATGDPDHPDLADRLVKARPSVIRRIKQYVHPDGMIKGKLSAEGRAAIADEIAVLDYVVSCKRILWENALTVIIPDNDDWELEALMQTI